MSGWDRLKRWRDGEVLMSADLNGELDNLGLINEFDWEWSGAQTWDSGVAKFKGAGAGLATVRNTNTATSRVTELPDIGSDDTLLETDASEANPSRGEILGSFDATGRLTFGQPGLAALCAFGYWNAAATPSFGVGSLEGVMGAGGHNSNGAPTLTSSSDSNGLRLQVATGALSSNFSCVRSTSLQFTLNAKPYFVLKFALIDLTALHFFCGISASSGGAANLDTSRPLTGHAGLSFSPAAGDTTFQLSHDLTGGSVTVEDTGLAPSIGVYFLVMDGTSGTSWNFTLTNAVLTTLWSGTVSSDLPATTTGVTPFVGIETRENVSKQIAYYFCAATVLGSVV